MAQKATAFTVEAEESDDKPWKRKNLQKSTKTFVELLKEKYCSPHDVQGKGYTIVFHGKPKSKDEGELAYLRNVCLNNSGIHKFGLEGQSLKTLCPNIVDLDLSDNVLESWPELLSSLSHLDNLSFLNLARNRLSKDKESLHTWTGCLPKLDNLVLNGTNIRWQEVLALSRLLPCLRELHLSQNNYKQLPDMSGDSLSTVECLRMNENNIQSWEEVWKLRHLPKLNLLILSGNPLQDIFYKSADTGKSGKDNLKLAGTEGRTMEAGVKETNEMEGIASQREAVLGASVALGAKQSDSEIKTPSKKQIVNAKHNVGDNKGIEKHEDDAKLNIGDMKSTQVGDAKHNIGDVKLKDTELEVGDAKYNVGDIRDTKLETGDREYIVEMELGDKTEEEQKVANTETTEQAMGDKTDIKQQAGDTSEEQMCDTKADANEVTELPHVEETGQTGNQQVGDIAEERMCDTQTNATKDTEVQVDDIKDIELPHVEETGQSGNWEDKETTSTVNTEQDIDITQSGKQTDKETTNINTEQDIDITQSGKQKDIETTIGNTEQDMDITEHSNLDQITDTSQQPNIQQDIETIKHTELHQDINTNQQADIAPIATTQQSAQQQNQNMDTAQQPDIVPISTTQQAEQPENMDTPSSTGPFRALECLCVSQTQLGKWKHLTALKQFPALNQLRAKDVKLGSAHSQEDRRKLFIACLPTIKKLNGSEVTHTEREKSERHLLRYFSDKKHKPDIYSTLATKHGELEALVDIDISKGYQEFVTLTFIHKSEVKFTESLCVREPVTKLKILIAKKMKVRFGWNEQLRVYHYFTSPLHKYVESPFEEVSWSALPLSRFDLMDGDEIHFEIIEKPLPSSIHFILKR